MNSLDSANDLSLTDLRNQIRKIAGIEVKLNQADNLNDLYFRNISREIFGDANNDGINDFKINVKGD